MNNQELDKMTKREKLQECLRLYVERREMLEEYLERTQDQIEDTKFRLELEERESDFKARHDTITE